MQQLLAAQASLDNLSQLLSPELAVAYQHTLQQGLADRQRDQAASQQIGLVGIWQPEYPAPLLHLEAPPMVLYCRGPWPSIEHSVALVGTRHPAAWGLGLASQLGRELAQLGLTVISGLARGIDTAAHRGAVEAGGPSLAVLGTPLDQIYPPENEALARQLSLVSEIPLGGKVAPGLFARRNRIVAALARVLVVVQAPLKSGALITAREALELGREVGAVPGRPADLASEGCHRLIRDGAALVCGVADILALLGLRASPPPGLALEEPLATLYRALVVLGLTLPEELQLQTGWLLPQVMVGLADLELRGLVRQAGGGRYVAS